MRAYLCGALMTFGALAAYVGAEEAKDFSSNAKTVLRGDRGNDVGPVRFAKADTIVIRSAEELVVHSTQPDKAKDADMQKQMTQALAKMFEVEAIDWDKKMVIGIRGPFSNTHTTMNFVSMKPEDKKLTVTWKVDLRFSPGVPKGLALVDRFDGEVKFEHAEKK